MGIKKNIFAPLALGLGATRRAAMLLLVMMLTTATALADSTYGHKGSGTANDPYQISTLRQWKDFANLVLYENDTYGDKCYKLTADIEVPTGSWLDDELVIVGADVRTPFRGTLDGGGHTLTFKFLTAGEVGAPFCYISGATISNLRVAGVITANNSSSYAAGIASFAMGSNTVSGCTVSSTIYSSGSNPGYHGGLVGQVNSGATLTISDCTFSGSFTGSVTMVCGGFVGYNAGTVSITDCLFNPSTVSINGKFLYSFCNDSGGSSTLTRAYRTFDSNASMNQGTRVYTEAPATTLTKRMTFGGNTYYAEGNAAITGVNDAYGYTGSSLDLPTAGVRFDGAALGAAHYDVVFRNSSDAVVSSLDAGTYTVTATGKGDYAGSVSKTFTVTVGDGSLEHPYQIGTPAEWDAFAAQVTGGNNYSGKYVRLTADISVTTMAGDYTHSFNGTFLGGGHTLTIDISDNSNNANIAPFRSVNGATISDLTVAGSVSSKGMYAATLVGASSGSTQFTNCHSTATLNGTHNGYSYDGGFVGLNDGTQTFDRCSFKGRLLGTQTYSCGGFVGQNQHATANFTDCLFAPAEVTMGTNGSGTFVLPGSGSTTTFTRTYCTTAFGAVQGTKVTAQAPDGICKPVVSAVDGATYYSTACTVSGIAASYDLAAVPIHPEPVVKDGNTTLTKDVDYMLHWDEVSAADGDYTLTVTGMGSYMGLATVGYTVQSTTGTFGGKTFVKGKDGEGDFFVIATEEDLRNLSTAVNAGNNSSGKRFVQTADIDLSSGGNFTPIGIDYYTDKQFSGTYDGGHHAISGLKVSTSSGSAGLFGELDNGTVKNVRIMAPSVTSTEGISGAVVGLIRSGTVTQCITINPTISGGFESGAISGLGNCTNSYYYGGNQTTSGTRVYKVTLSKGLDVATAYTGDGTDANGARISSGTYAGYYAAKGKTVTLSGGTAPAGYLFSGYSSDDVTITDGAFTMPAADVAVAATFAPDPAHFSVNDAGTEYTIHTATGWGVFCDCLQDNDTWNRFSGKTVRLGANITVTRMAGSAHHDFCGTFDGGGHTLTVNISSDDITDGSTQYVAPFRFVSNTKADPSDEADSPAAFRNLHVTGTITTDKQFTGGLIGGCWGTVSIENCRVSVTIQSTISGDGTNGGIVGIQQTGALTITGCLFDGSLLGATTYAVGGFLGWRKSGAEIRNSLFAPAEVTVLNTSGATFARNKVDTYNSYYTYYLCDGTNYAPYDPADADHPDKYNNGHATRTVAAAADVTIDAIALTGDVTAQYTVSGITAYSGGGLQRGQTLYYGSGDQLSLTLSNSATGAPLGYQYAYTASAGTLTGSAASGWTLQMADADATISIDTSQPHSTDQSVTLSYVTADGTPAQTDQAIALDGTETSLAAGTYFVGLPTVQFDHTLTLNGNVTLILKDGCTMNVGTDESRISGKGFTSPTSGTNALTIYGQTLGTGHLNIYSTSNASANHGSIAILGSVNVNGGNVTIRHYGYYGQGIYANNSLTVNGGNVDVKSDNCTAISISKAITINGGTVIADGYANGLQCTAGSVTINGGTVTTNGRSYGIWAGGSVAINGGTVNATCGEYGTGIRAGGTITLGWTKPTDRITASSYSGTVQVADGKKLHNGSDYLDGTLDDPAADVNGKTLRPAATATYTTADGTADTADAILLDASDNSLPAGNYLATGTLNYTHGITLTGDVTLILADNCHMNVGTSGERINGSGIKRSNSPTLTITSEANGSGNGALSVYTTGNNNTGILATSITINGGHVTADTEGNGCHALSAFVTDITINGGTVTARTAGTDASAICAYGDINYNGGDVTATATGSGGYGIESASSGITLGWTRPDDRITASSYRASGTVKVADGQALTDGSGHIYTGTLSAADLDAINGKTLRPCLALADAADNTAAIADHAGQTLAVALSGRTLYKDGAWNTLCLPFSVTTASGPLSGDNVQAMTLNTTTSNLADGTLTLNFDAAETIPAGTPFIIKWDNTGVNITNPVFDGVTVSNTTNDATVEDVLTFTGTYAPVSIGSEGDNTKLYLGAANKLYYPNAAMTIGTHRAYFQLADGITAGEPASLVRAFNLNFGDDEATGIISVHDSGFTVNGSDAWYTLDGRRLDGQPTAKGLYIHGGKKVAIK